MIAENLTGRTLGAYHLLEMIGKGGMGVVYRAVRPGVSGEVAIKILSTSSPEYIKRFRQETEIISKLRHPHIVRVYDHDTKDGFIYVVMQLLTGKSLADRLYMGRGDKYPRIEVRRVVQIISQIASALDYAHSQGVIHRDVKTSNILFDEKDQPYLVDFGVAKMTAHNATSLTSSGMIVGTLPYVAPEQLRDDPLTPAADQYALAVMTYYILTGRMPFSAESTYAIMQKLLFEDPTPLSEVRQDLPDEVMDVIKRGMAKKAEDRYASAGAYAAALTNAVSSTKPITRRRTGELQAIGKNTTLPKTETDLLSTKRQRRGGRGLIFLVALLLLAVTGGVIATRTPLLSEFIESADGQAAATAEICRVRPIQSANIRETPDDDVETNILRAYRSDEVVLPVIGRTTDDDGDLWWQVIVPQFNQDFWVADKVVNTIGECGKIPLIATTPE
jgi:serine/threonine protein kinase